MKEIFPVFGIIAPVVYVLAVVIGGFLLKDYSHMYNSISELTASDVPKKPITFILFFIYNLSLGLFGYGLLNNLSNAGGVLVKAAAVMLIVVGLMGIAMLYYVQEPRNNPMTYIGKIHLILAGISSLLTMVVIILLGLTFSGKLKLYSFVSFSIVFIAGGIAAISVAKNSPFGGLFERLTIGAFMQWIFVIALSIL